MKQFAPRIHDKKTGETFRIISIAYNEPIEIYLLADINTGEAAREADGNSIAYTCSKVLIGTNGWRDIADVTFLLPTLPLRYDENGEMIYVSSEEVEHEND